MKKMLIGALVGSVILFLWQFLSWGLMELHEMRHTDKQDAILEALNEAGLEDGVYFVPRTPPGASDEEMQAMMEASEGKPWALINYRSSMQNQMGLNMFRGWAVSFVAVLILCWLLLQFAELNLSKAVMGSLAVGIIGYLTIPYLNSIWFETNSWADLVDAVVSWGVCGAWLGWWLPRT